jgi:hypothetical protein
MKDRDFCASLLVVLCGALFACNSVQYRKVSCRLFPDGDPTSCEQTSDGGLVVPAHMLQHAAFGSGGIATVLTGPKNLYFVTRRGKTAPALPFDNGPDYFSEGLARTVRNGRVGFVNAELDQVVSPIWDFAFPFEKGVAVVCTGCTVNRLGEHAVMQGGKWGYINTRGAIVVPVVYNQTALPPNEVAAKAAGTVQ